MKILRPINLDTFKSNAIFTADSQVTPTNTELFHYWFLLGYQSLCIPFKSVLNPDGRNELKYNKIQQVTNFTDYRDLFKLNNQVQPL